MSLAERGGLEEERRLMYVAITRARKRLYITMAQQRMLHGQTQFGIVSRFVEEIPPEVLHYLSVKKPAFDSYGNTRQTAAPKDKIIDELQTAPNLRRLPHRTKRAATPNSAPASSRCRGQRRIRPTDHQLRQTGRERIGHQVCEIGRDVEIRRLGMIKAV